MRSIQELADEAIKVQDACNLSGVLLSYHTACVNLRNTLADTGKPSDTDSVNKHSIMQLWADKVASLTGTQGWTFADGSKAYETVYKLAGRS